MTTCSIEGCERPVVARNLCQSHYNTHRESARRAAARSESRPCKNCGKDLAGKRPNAVYCSPTCKYEALDADRRAEVALKREGRTCLACGGPITSHSTKAKCCSKACSVKWQNTKKTEERDAAAAERPPCVECGGPVSIKRHLGAIYCSTACNKKAQTRRWRERAPHYMRLYTYGITAVEFDELMAAQNGCCAVCGSDEWVGKDRAPHVDHDHKTGAVRGLLCSRCNHMLGNAMDNPEILAKGIAYLHKHT